MVQSLKVKMYLNLHCYVARLSQVMLTFLVAVLCCNPNYQQLNFGLS